eukprot:CAMPEP_0172454540 /NCGR_PEP_ID=MMETSP1065-20121228/11501_1 /TAXON_ID=265537 /ORGANISM="Amphiprora paludosa, Strain CCMP125" /LENGTH=38 /DNA_ID= /DNA_START= /DNA_END= /DNA_ORIENTATION=
MNLNLVSLEADAVYMYKTAEKGEISLGGIQISEPGGVE